MSNTLMIFVTFFFYDFNVIESKKKIFRAPVPWTNTSKYKYKIKKKSESFEHEKEKQVHIILPMIMTY